MQNKQRISDDILNEEKCKMVEGKKLKTFKVQQILLIQARKLLFLRLGLDYHETMNSFYPCPGSHTLVISFSKIACGQSLLVLQSDDWDRDLSPWPAQGPFKNSFPGHADDFIRTMEKQINEAEAGLSINRRIAIGYSLSALFFLYAASVTSLLDKVACVSGSLWYPGFEEYIETHGLSQRTSAVYLSLGDRESRSRNPLLSTVLEKTQSMAEILKRKGCKVTFEMTEGGHFDNQEGRVSRALESVLLTES